jgi:hypothetical protein
MRWAICALVLLTSLGVRHPADAAGEFFIAPDGSDESPGTREQPFASPQRARDAIRELKRGEGLPDGGVTVWLREGTYQGWAKRTVGRQTAPSCTGPTKARRCG